MSRLLRADLYRMYRGIIFWTSLGSMFGIAGMLSVMQYTSMSYEVPLSRVIFLPMSFYGVIAAALVSFFVGEDYHDGVIRNKLVAGHTRNNIYLSNLICSLLACLTIYVVISLILTAIGSSFFENDVTIENFVKFFLLGILTCLAMGSIFGMLSMLIGERTIGVMVCMALAFGMLFLCLHTNQIVIQEPYKNGQVNPNYMGGVLRKIYELIHDLNPMGQAAQLSSMEYLNLTRWIILDIFWIGFTMILGNRLFLKRDMK